MHDVGTIVNDCVLHCNFVNLTCLYAIDSRTTFYFNTRQLNYKLALSNELKNNTNFLGIHENVRVHVALLVGL